MASNEQDLALVSHDHLIIFPLVVLPQPRKVFFVFFKALLKEI